MAKQTGSYDFTAARAAAEMADDISQHFWTKSTGGTTDIPTGSYVTEVPEEEFTDPNHVNYCAGGNLVLQSNRVRMRMAAVTLAELTGTALNIYEPSDSVNPTAQFKGSGTIIGKETEYHISIGSSVIDFLLNTTQLFSIIWDSVYSYCALRRSATSGTTNLYNIVHLADGGVTTYSEQVEQYNARKRIASAGASTGSAVASAGIQAEYDETNSGGIDITGQIGISARSGHADGYVYGDHFYIYPAYTGSDDPAAADIDGTGKGTFSALDSGVFDITTETLFTSTSISGGSHKYSTVDINDASRAKYYPLGIVGWNSPDTSQFVPARMRLSGRAIGSATVSYDIRNVGSSSVSGKVTCDILWLKVTA